MKTATCTHCNCRITYDDSRKEWMHDDPSARTNNRLTCAPIQFATPKRGSITKAA